MVISSLRTTLCRSNLPLNRLPCLTSQSLQRDSLPEVNILDHQVEVARLVGTKESLNWICLWVFLSSSPCNRTTPPTHLPSSSPKHSLKMQSRCDLDRTGEKTSKLTWELKSLFMLNLRLQGNKCYRWKWPTKKTLFSCTNLPALSRTSMPSRVSSHYWLTSRPFLKASLNY
jgi:hypothetical protein